MTKAASHSSQNPALLEAEALASSEREQAEQKTPSASTLENQLLGILSVPVEDLGYRIIYLEFQSHRQKVLRLFIDHFQKGSIDPSAQTHPQEVGSPQRQARIGIEDCVKVSRALEPLLDENQAIQALLPTAYELEVSSPGADRPLRTVQDFADFAGNWVKIHLFRPLSAEEIENPVFQEKNPRQKNFLGKITGVKNGKVLLDLNDQERANAKGSKKGLSRKVKNLGKEKSSEGEGKVCIPIPMISKANLEPQFEFEPLSERES